MPGKPVARILRIDGASDLDEPHQIPDRNRKVENVFEGAAVDRKIELSNQIFPQWHADVLNDGRTFIVRKVDAGYGVKFEPLEAYRLLSRPINEQATPTP
jgi:hypothetical protein